MSESKIDPKEIPLSFLLTGAFVVWAVIAAAEEL